MVVFWELWALTSLAAAFRQFEAPHQKGKKIKQNNKRKSQNRRRTEVTARRQEARRPIWRGRGGWRRASDRRRLRHWGGRSATS